MQRRTPVGRFLLLAAAFALAGVATADDRPNILFIMTDQQFADVMSCVMGREYLHTPAMDSLAAHGARFTRAYTPNPLCMPARASIFTGRYPHQTGIQANVGRQLDPRELVSMGTCFRRAGYDTGYVGKWHLVYPKNDPTTHGFDFTAVLRNNGHDHEMPAAAADFLARARRKPFLLVVSFSNPHDMCQLARDQELPGGSIGEAPPLAERPPLVANHLPPRDETDVMSLMRRSYHNTKMFPVGDYDEGRWRRLIWGYYRLVEKVDREIARVLASLRDAGAEDNTLVVFTSDHGDCHGAHGFNQKTVFYEESTRVPMILSFPGRIGPKTCEQLVNTGVDILPTLLDYARIDPPRPLPGRSLRGLAEGHDLSTWREFVVAQNFMIQGGEVDGVTPRVHGRMVRSDRYKYCLYDTGRQREALFDLHADPGETRNIARDPDAAGVLARHREYLRTHAERHGDQMAASMLTAID